MNRVCQWFSLKQLIIRYVSGIELIFTDVYLFRLTLMNSQKKLKKKEIKFISVKHKRKQKQNFIEVENEITYGKSNSKQSIAENLIIFRHFTIKVSYLVLMICVSRKLHFVLCIWSLEIIKMNRKILTLRQWWYIL